MSAKLSLQAVGVVCKGTESQALSPFCTDVLLEAEARGSGASVPQLQC